MSRQDTGSKGQSVSYSSVVESGPQTLMGDSRQHCTPALHSQPQSPYSRTLLLKEEKGSRRSSYWEEYLSSVSSLPIPCMGKGMHAVSHHGLESLGSREDRIRAGGEGARVPVLI